MEDKRQIIIHKAFELYREFGIKSVSMDDIARNLGMSKKTLYQFIQDKHELIESVVRFLKDKIIGSFAVFHSNEFNAIEQFFELQKMVQPERNNYRPSFYYDMNKYYPELMNGIKEEKLKCIEEAMLANLKQGKEEGFYQEDIDENIIARVLVSYHLFTFDPNAGLFSEVEVMEDKTFEEVFKYHFRGVCTKKGMDELQKLFCDSKTNKQK